MPITDTGKCKCYVAQLPPQVRFGLRWGAHEVDCLVYRESRDPVDQEQDKVLRWGYLDGLEYAEFGP